MRRTITSEVHGRGGEAPSPHGCSCLQKRNAIKIKHERNISIIMYVATAISSRASVSAAAQGHPAASSCLVGFGMSVRREFRLPGSRTACAECRHSPCLPILHKQHDAPTGGNTQEGKKIHFRPNAEPTLYQVEVHRVNNYNVPCTLFWCSILVRSRRLKADCA